MRLFRQVFRLLFVGAIGGALVGFAHSDTLRRTLVGVQCTRLGGQVSQEHHLVFEGPHLVNKDSTKCRVTQNP